MILFRVPTNGTLASAKNSERQKFGEAGGTRIIYPPDPRKHKEAVLPKKIDPSGQAQVPTRWTFREGRKAFGVHAEQTCSLSGKTHAFYCIRFMAQMKSMKETFWWKM